MRWLTDQVILTVGWLWFAIYAYPGYMSYDSVYQLSQARGLEPVNEWHPPMMAMLWRVADCFVAGPLPMLVIQSVTFLVGLYAILRHVISPRAAAIAAVLVLVAPQNIIVMAVIWKDSQMAGFLLAGIAALLSSDRRWRIAGLGFVFLATAVRYNAAAATLPILVLLWRVDRPRLQRYAIAVGIWLAITLAAFGINRVLVEKNVYPWHTGAAPVDIVGTLNFAPTISDAELLAIPDVPWAVTTGIQAQARKSYKPTRAFLDLVQGGTAVFQVPTTKEQRLAIAALWKHLVFGYPTAFVRQRFAVFFAQLKSRGVVWSEFVNTPENAQMLGHHGVHSEMQQAWIDVLKPLSRTFLFRIWLYFALALALLPFAIVRREAIAGVMLSSAILYQLGLLALAPAVDYRYSHWLIVATIIGAIILVARRAQSRVGDGLVERAA